jgi:hypothetical protein
VAHGSKCLTTYRNSDIISRDLREALPISSFMFSDIRVQVANFAPMTLWNFFLHILTLYLQYNLIELRERNPNFSKDPKT